MKKNLILNNRYKKVDRYKSKVTKWLRPKSKELLHSELLDCQKSDLEVKFTILKIWPPPFTLDKKPSNSISPEAHTCFKRRTTSRQQSRKLSTATST